MIYSPETDTTLILTSLTNIWTYWLKAFWRCSLCARWLLVLTPASSFLLPPAPCCLLPRWGLTAYLPPCSGGLALPNPLAPSPELTPFPSGPRQCPTLVSGTTLYFSVGSTTCPHDPSANFWINLYWAKICIFNLDIWTLFLQQTWFFKMKFLKPKTFLFENLNYIY